MGKAKIVVWDIECTNLSSNYGYILCISWKVLGEKKVHTVKITDSPVFHKDPTNDKYVVEQAAKELSKADIWVYHYGSKFDRPYVNSRLLYHNLDPMPNVPDIDTWRISRYKLKLNSNRLQTITSFFGFEDKTPLSGPIWVKAMAGHRPSINYVVKHCEQDVRVLEQVYAKIRCLSPKHPNVNIVDAAKKSCPICGSKRVQKRGFSIASVSRTQRYFCKSCKGWSRGRPERIPGLEIR